MERTQGWSEAWFKMFIHFGAYAIPVCNNNFRMKYLFNNK
jgi:hypothetical protein